MFINMYQITMLQNKSTKIESCIIAIIIVAIIVAIILFFIFKKKIYWYISKIHGC